MREPKVGEIWHNPSLDSEEESEVIGVDPPKVRILKIGKCRVSPRIPGSILVYDDVKNFYQQLPEFLRYNEVEWIKQILSKYLD